MEHPLPANHASSRQPGTTCENRGLRTRILSTIKSQPSTFLFLDLPGGSAVFQKDGIIGEARIQPQAALQWNFIPRIGGLGFGSWDFGLPSVAPVHHSQAKADVLRSPTQCGTKEDWQRREPFLPRRSLT